MIVLRVEHPTTGRGMYNTNPETGQSWAHGAGMPDSANERHPMPHQDSLFRRNHEYANQPYDGYVFGFADKAQLRSWLYEDEFRRNLQEDGLVLSLYEVPSAYVISGYTQLTFNREHAEKVGRLDLVTLEPV